VNNDAAKRTSLCPQLYFHYIRDDHAQIRSVMPRSHAPRGAQAPPFPLVHSLYRLLLFFTFSLFSFSYSLYLFSSVVHPFPFRTRIVSLRFQAGGRRKLLNVGLVFLCLFCVIRIYF